MKRNEKKQVQRLWIKIILGAFLIFCLSISIYLFKLYQTIEATKFTHIDKTYADLLQSNEIDDIQATYQFQDEYLYHIFFGTVEPEGERVIFVPVNVDDDAVIINREDILSEDIIIKRAQQDCDNCRFVTINPAMIQNEPLWEIIFYDAQGRYVMDYLSMYNGERFEQIRLIRKYKERS